MDCVRLRVQTVPASDPVTLKIHTAYTVMSIETTAEVMQYAPGWTLRDAIENFCDWFHIERAKIVLLRPFHPQKVESNDCF